MKQEQINRYKKYTKITGITIMAVYISFGIFGYSVMDQDQLSQMQNSFLGDLNLKINEAFADDSTEGINYLVEISDSIGTKDSIR